MKKLVAGLFAFALTLGVALGESKFATHATKGELVFAPRELSTITLTSLSADATLDPSWSIKIYARGGAGAVATGANATNGAKVITLTNTGNIFNTNDVVVYDHADGSVDETTVASVTATTVTLTDGISSAGATGDRLIEVTEQYRFVRASAAAVDVAGSALFVAPMDSPLYISVTATDTVTLAATVIR